MFSARLAFATSPCARMLHNTRNDSASIPLVNLILFYYVALNPWPREGTWNGPGDGEGDARF